MLQVCAAVAHVADEGLLLGEEGEADQTEVYCEGVSAEFLLLEYARLSDDSVRHGDSSHFFEGVIRRDPADQDEIVVNAPWSAVAEYRIQTVQESRAGSLAGLGDHGAAARGLFDIRPPAGPGQLDRFRPIEER